MTGNVHKYWYLSKYGFLFMRGDFGGGDPKLKREALVDLMES